MTIKTIICDIDGVLMQDDFALPGAEPFLTRIQKQGIPLVLLTNYPSQTAQELSNRFHRAGLKVAPECFYSSAMATADFLATQALKKAYVIGEGGLIHALYQAGFTLTQNDPEVVIVGETRAYNWEMIKKASAFVSQGARFIATNPDTHGGDFGPACGALCAPIEKISGQAPFYVGKPNPWILRAALNTINAHFKNAIIIGDNLKTDILAGFQAGLQTILVLSGISTRDQDERLPYRPTYIFPSVSDIDIV